MGAQDKNVGTLQGLGVIAVATAGIIFFGVGGFDFSSPADDAAEKAAYEQRRCEDSGMALIMSQNFVKRGLSNPESAQFLRNTGNDYIGECRHKISGAFDAKNGFGATVRSTYSVTMVYLPESKRWSASGLVIR